jgi:hypothetical protein
MMMKLLTTLLVVWCLVLTACPKNNTLEKLENLATELRIHNRNIAQVSNQFHAEGRMADADHLRILTAASSFSKALDKADAAIAAAKAAPNIERKSFINYAERILDVETFPAFLQIVEAVTDVPADVKAKLERILSLIRIAFSAIRALLADAGAVLKQEELIYAE